MLIYRHIYNNTNFKQPYNLMALDSDTTNIAVYVNGKLQDIVSPNIVKEGYEFGIYKHKLTDLEIMNLLVAGTDKSYSNSLNKVIFGPTNMVYIYSTLYQRYLYKDTEGNFSWDATNKSRFFFNPYYFDSEYLWTKLFKKLPDSITVTGLWDKESEFDLFNKATIEVNITNLPTSSEPKVLDYFTTTSLEESIYIDKFLYLEAKIGDKIDIKTDKEILSFKYNPLRNPQMIIPDIDGTTVSRPWIHIPIRTLDPNSERLYTKILNKGINSFNISITEGSSTFSDTITITRT